MGEGGGWERDVRFTGQIQLGVIREAIEMDAKFMKDRSEWKEINIEEEGPMIELWGTCEVAGEVYEVKDLSWMN